MATLTVEIHAYATVRQTRPPPTTTFVPRRTATCVPTSDPTATDVATGSSRSPVSSGP